jgi:hypothetical protein
VFQLWLHESNLIQEQDVMTLKENSYLKPLNRQETADYLGYSLQKMDRLAKKKKPVFHKNGKESCYHIADLEEYEKEQQTF